MKKALVLLSVAILALSACQTKPETKTVNIEGEKAAVDSLFLKYQAAMIAKDFNAVSGLMAEDFVSYGTDPSEFFNKKDLLDYWQKGLSDTALKIDYTVSKRDIKIAPDGQSAVIVEQFMMPLMRAK